MNEIEVKAQIELITKGVEGLQTELKGKNVEFGDFSKKLGDLSDKINALTDKKFSEEMQKQLNSLESKMNDVLIKDGKMKVLTLKEGLAKAFQSEQFKKAASNKGGNYDISLKTGTVLDSTTTYLQQDTGTIMILQEYEPGVAHVPFRTTPFTDLVAKGTIGENKNSVNWVERTAITDNTASVAEGGIFNNLTAVWKRYIANVKKIGDFIKVTREDLEDWEYTVSEVMDLLNSLIPRNLEYQLINGAGAGNDLTGILSASTAFSKPNGVIVPAGSKNIYDLLKVAATQVMLGDTAKAYGMGFMANFVLLNPVDIANMHLTKDTIGQYVLPPFVAANGLEVDGMKVLPSFDITADSFLIGDSSKAKLFTKRALSVRMWEQNEADPLYDQVTFTGSLRAAFRVKNLEKFAFVKGTISTSLATL